LAQKIAENTPFLAADIRGTRFDAKHLELVDSLKRLKGNA